MNYLYDLKTGEELISLTRQVEKDYNITNEELYDALYYHAIKTKINESHTNKDVENYVKSLRSKGIKPMSKEMYKSKVRHL